MIRPPPNSTPTYTPFPDTNALPILGVSALVPAADGGWTPIAGEGGHVSFAPRNEREFALWRAAHAQFGHVSMECMLSGPGLRFIYQNLRSEEHTSELQSLISNPYGVFFLKKQTNRILQVNNI